MVAQFSIGLHIFILYSYLCICSGFLLHQQPPCKSRRCCPGACRSTISGSSISSSALRDYLSTRLFMGDHSSATVFQVGDTVTVIEDVMKAGKNLKGLSGTVTYTWEKCDVDPTCCCAEWVDEGLSVHVKFNVDNEEGEGNGLFANDTFIHYFAESELVEKKEDDVQQSTPPVAFDGLSCKAFKLDKLSMGEQARRIKAFEESQKNK